jgi:hypothetical protein
VCSEACFSDYLNGIFEHIEETMRARWEEDTEQAIRTDSSVSALPVDGFYVERIFKIAHLAYKDTKSNKPRLSNVAYDAIDSNVSWLYNKLRDSDTASPYAEWFVPHTSADTNRLQKVGTENNYKIEVYTPRTYSEEHSARVKLDHQKPSPLSSSVAPLSISFHKARAEKLVIMNARA